MNKHRIISIAKYALIAATLAIVGAFYCRHFQVAVTNEEAQSVCNATKGCKKALTRTGYDAAGHRPVTILSVVIDRKIGGGHAAQAFENAVDELKTPRKIAMSIVGVAQLVEVGYE